ncbi:MAG: hypothetical protein ACD_28C00362G0003 [uncultured bacterium]|nr:MAG: hypothetical protein ACD_28C00362G0003 [uncultured bacterium]KKT76968.1 MAG: hypothetical protein UW70_C0007G0025 [Candidatus Peregrinibacteria bacterium GW2011_GWA2_44_7]
MKRIEHGQVCDVEIENGLVRKTPRKITATQLFDRMKGVLTAMQESYFDDVKTKPAVLETSLNESNGQLIQSYFGKKSLAEMNRDEILKLPENQKEALIDLLLCSEVMRVEIGNFVDLLGYSKGTNPIQGIIRALDPRYSSNIRVSEIGEVELIDCDWYYRKERSWLRKLGAYGLTPVIAYFTQKLRRQLILSL